MSKKLVAFSGSLRKGSNTTLLMEQFLNGTQRNYPQAEAYNAAELNLDYCHGCLRCNRLGHCSLDDDYWLTLAGKILDADILLFASPVYFHHVSAPMKKLIDRFRSFVRVQVTETGLEHTPHTEWKKDFVLLLTMGSSDSADAAPVIELFRFMTSILGKNNQLHVITANRLIIPNQLIQNEEKLTKLYRILKLPPQLARVDAAKNREIMEKVFMLGTALTMDKF